MMVKVLESRLLQIGKGNCQAVMLRTMAGAIIP